MVPINSLAEIKARANEENMVEQEGRELEGRTRCAKCRCFTELS